MRGLLRAGRERNGQIGGKSGTNRANRYSIAVRADLIKSAGRLQRVKQKNTTKKQGNKGNKLSI
ncbi:hypothetical protein M087_4208 [Bacteroides fragilis str. S23 R14]|nr:hypothetical protein M087_4208 [Bacteroides fragilis str. S23 R14]EYA64238.1 hypothetical protein M139_4484 [Bacteroides fragilis str. S23L24]EYE41555.1 hypothetical protein M138_4443 [Bacteroides fragilis str. S23L17]